MKGNNFHHANKSGLALAPQSVNNATVTGPAIEEPWRSGNQLSFILLGGAFASGVDGAMTVQGLRRDDGTTWEALKESDGTTDLAFTATLLDDAGGLEGGSVVGTLPFDSGGYEETYKSVRLSYTESGSAAALIGAAYVISDLRGKVSGQSDDLFSKARHG